MLVLLSVVVVLLVVFALGYDIVMRKRDRYRPSGDWLAISRRRRSHFRRTREERRTLGDDRR